MYSCCTVLYNQLLIVDWKKNLIDWKMLSHFQWSLYDNIGRWWRWYLRAHHINQINRRKILWRWAQEDTSMPRTLGTWLGFWRHNSRRSHMPKGSLRFFILYIVYVYIFWCAVLCCVYYVPKCHPSKSTRTVMMSRDA